MSTELVTIDARLDERESVIRKGQRTFVEVGEALCDIRDNRLYTARGFGSFQEYCAEVWGWTDSRARQLIGAADIAKTVTNVTLPNEATARELARVPESKREEVLTKAKKSGKVTAKAIREAADDVEPTEEGLIPGPPPEVEPEEVPHIVTYDKEFKKALGNPEPTPLALQLLENIEVEVANMRLLTEMVRENTCDCGAAGEIKMHVNVLLKCLAKWLKENGCQ